MHQNKRNVQKIVKLKFKVKETLIVVKHLTAHSKL